MQHVGPLSLVFFWFSIIFILEKWDFDVKLTISDHVKSGVARNTYVPSVLVTISAFTAFMILWFLPEFEAHWSAYMFMSLAYLNKLATTFVPRRQRSMVFHDATASLVGLSLLLMLVSLTLESNVSDGFVALLRASIVAMGALGIMVMNRNQPTYLVLQGFYFLIFTLNVITLTYLAT